MLLGSLCCKPENSCVRKQTDVTQDMSGNSNERIFAWLEEALKYPSIGATELKPMILQPIIHEAIVKRYRQKC